MTVFPLNPNLAFAWWVSRKGKSGMVALETGSRLAFHAHMWGDQLDSYVIAMCETLLAVAHRQNAGQVRDQMFEARMAKETQQPRKGARPK